MAKKGQKFEKYSNELKEQVINEIKLGKALRVVAKKYGLPNGTIMTWSYKVNHPEKSTGNKRGRPKDSEVDYKERYEILKKYRAFLKAQRERK